MAEQPTLQREAISWGVRRPGMFRRWLGATSLITTLAGGLLIGTDSARLHPGTYSEPNALAGLGGLSLVIGCFALLTWLIAAVSAPSPTELGLPGTLLVQGDRLVLQDSGQVDVPFADIEAGWTEGGDRVLLRLRDGRELTIAGLDDDTITALLGAVGVTERVARVPIGSALSARLGGQAAGCSALVLLMPFAITVVATLGGALVSAARGLMGGGELGDAVLRCLPVLLGLLVVVQLRAPRKAAVGADGVAIEGLFGRRFLPFRELAGADPTARGVVLRRNRGWFRKVLLPSVPGGESLHQHIQRAMDALGQAAATLDVERLGRRDRSIADWVADLKGLTDEGKSNYRVSALLPEQLAAVVEDAAARPEHRIAAAVAVAQSRDEAARGRVRIAAQTSADEEMRAALEQAAEGEIDEEALRRVARRST